MPFGYGIVLVKLVFRNINFSFTKLYKFFYLKQYYTYTFLMQLQNLLEFNIIHVVFFMANRNYSLSLTSENSYILVSRAVKAAYY